MSKWTANPVEVDAWEILSVGMPRPQDGARPMTLKDGGETWATREMLARMTPIPGDYFVRQADGYEYLNPRLTFLRKYSPVAE